MILETLQAEMKKALIAKDGFRLNLVRSLISSLNYEKINKQHDLSENEEQSVLRFEAKKRKDAINAYKSAKLDEKAEIEKRELDIISEFLPKEMDEQEIINILNEVVKDIKPELSNTGKIIGEVIKRSLGRADGQTVSSLVKSKLHD